MIHSDWHIHSEYSYDADNTLKEITDAAKKQGLYRVGITDHANYNDEKFIGDLTRSAEAVNALKRENPLIILGVELTPIEKPLFDYISKHGTREGYIAPDTSEPYGIELARTKEELMALGVQYAIGAAHWRVDKLCTQEDRLDVDASIKEWYRQQLMLANDERVTVLGHPWWSGRALWYDDFSRIPRSMNDDIAESLRKNGKYAECNSHFFLAKEISEKCRMQYAEFLRELFEKGVRITYGSDSHHAYGDSRSAVEVYLASAGFKDGDISQIDKKDLWQ